MAGAYLYHVSVSYKVRQFVVPSSIPVSLIDCVSADRYVSGTWGWNDVGEWKTFESQMRVTVKITFTDVEQVLSAFKRFKIRVNMYDAKNDIDHDFSHQIAGTVSEVETSFTLRADAYGKVR